MTARRKRDCMAKRVGLPGLSALPLRGCRLRRRCCTSLCGARYEPGKLYHAGEKQGYLLSVNQINNLVCAADKRVTQCRFVLFAFNLQQPAYGKR